MCNDAREDGVMFLSPEEFIGDMPEDYGDLTAKVYNAFKEQGELYKVLRESRNEKPEEFKECQKKYFILKEWYEDMLGCTKTVENYYEPGGDWDEKYCVLARICGREPFRHGSIVERLVIERLDAAAGGIELGTDDEFEATIEKVFPRIWGSSTLSFFVDEEAKRDYDYVSLRRDDTGKNSE